MKGYKAFRFDLSCRPLFCVPFVYETGRTYEMKGSPRLCKWGFHFCRALPDVYNWYASAFDTRVCEVEAEGTIMEDVSMPKCVTNRLTVVRELSPGEILAGLRDADPLKRSYIESHLLNSVQAFRHQPERYALWESKLSTQSRKSLGTELPRLCERADKWWALLRPVKQEGQS